MFETDGKTLNVELNGTKIQISLDDFTQEQRDRFAIHGLKDKLSRAASKHTFAVWPIEAVRKALVELGWKAAERVESQS